jgi:hypothetical protein
MFQVVFLGYCKTLSKIQILSNFAIRVYTLDRFVASVTSSTHESTPLTPPSRKITEPWSRLRFAKCGRPSWS